MTSYYPEVRSSPRINCRVYYMRMIYISVVTYYLQHHPAKFMRWVVARLTDLSRVQPLIAWCFRYLRKSYNSLKKKAAKNLYELYFKVHFIFALPWLIFLWKNLIEIHLSWRHFKKLWTAKNTIPLLISCPELQNKDMSYFVSSNEYCSFTSWWHILAS